MSFFGGEKVLMPSIKLNGFEFYQMMVYFKETSLVNLKSIPLMLDSLGLFHNKIPNYKDKHKLTSLPTIKLCWYTICHNIPLFRI